MFNARFETIDTSGASREGFKSRHCLIQADVYFEWTKDENCGKDPWLLKMPGGAPFSFARKWAHNDNFGITSYAIVTAPAVPAIAHIYTCMSPSLRKHVYQRWISRKQDSDGQALHRGLDQEPVAGKNW